MFDGMRGVQEAYRRMLAQATAPNLASPSLLLCVPTIRAQVAEGAVLSASEQKRVVTLEDGEYVCHDADYA